MTKLGEAANRLARGGVDSPEGVECGVADRNVIIRRYDEIFRELTWQGLAPGRARVSRRGGGLGRGARRTWAFGSTVRRLP
jgi:hypothetical protein